ncbi:hypothetical protein Cni_G21204 [Canna indica]|uniref:HTH myb-type domain-containing protein n=1 Tax=Canna indica TaxID=4628 RepID=A0AAQ3KVC7_9LILI|nr:hypothetical protein Cni_G21204 [Canna indica]
MLAVEHLRGSNGDDRDGTAMGHFSADDFADEALQLGDINFSDLFLGLDDGDVLPDLELDSEIFAEFSAAGVLEDTGAVTAGEAEQATTTTTTQDAAEVMDLEKLGASATTTTTTTTTTSTTAPSDARRLATAAHDDGNKGRKSSAAAKGSQGKRKAKVDWTPELHRRFVQAVEQLGIDKAVPSRILELMGIDCLTRHNIASHLQKYRSHRKHLLAREAEAASWSQRRRQMFTDGAKRPVDVNVHPWLAGAAPAIGILTPPPSAAVVPPLMRVPLHVWGHPTPEAPPPLLHYVWPRRPNTWPPQPPQDPSFWHHHYQRGGGEGWINPQAMMTNAAPCFAPARFVAPPVQGIVYRPPVPHPRPMSKNCSSQVQLDAHPSKECIDEAIGDVMEKPWLPLPLGLKPPSLDSVLVELEKEGVSLVP